MSAELSLGGVPISSTTPLPVDGTVSVGNFPATQAVSAASLPLPANAAKENSGHLETLTNRFPSCVYAHLATAAITTVKNGAGNLRAVVVNAKGTIASQVTLYDNTQGSGPKIAVIDSLNLAGTFFYDCAFSTGLTVVITGTIAPDLTVIYA